MAPDRLSGPIELRHRSVPASHETAWEVFAKRLHSSASALYDVVGNQHLEEYLKTKAVWIQTGWVILTSPRGERSKFAEREFRVRGRINES